MLAPVDGTGAEDAVPTQGGSELEVRGTLPALREDDDDVVP